jgi:hypothetical protein
MTRKSPILLRRGPLTGKVMAIYRYTRKPHSAERGGLIVAANDGKQDVTADFDALVLEGLLDPDSPNIVGILDGVADGQFLTADEKAEVRAFRERLRGLVVRHNETGHGAAFGGQR